MLHIAKPFIVVSTFLQPILVVPQKPLDHYSHETISDGALPSQNINDVITSEEVLDHIMKEIRERF
jgi:hypothetical protein